jgi:hypothetical protein
MTELIPPELQSFVLDNIDSVAELEALLLLHKYPEQDWPLPAAAQRLYIDEAAAAQVLERLASRGLCSAGVAGYRIVHTDPERVALVEALAKAYARYLIPVTNLIHHKPSRIQQFADAFKFRKDK